jgi:GDP-L-fucose synthase
MKKIFITGASGFLGKFLVNQLKNKFKKNIIYTPSSKECDLTKENSLIKFNKKFDTIFHLAAWTQAGDFCLKHPG